MIRASLFGSTMTELIRFDETHWPIVVVKYPARFHQSDFDQHIVRVVGFLKRDVPWAMLNDSRDAAAPNASQRQAIAKLYDDHEERVRKYWRGTAVVFDSPLIAGVLTALSWLRPPPHPFKAFSNYDDGMKWLKACMDPASRRVA